MNERVNPFANLAEAPTFATKPRKEKAIAEDAIAQIAEEHGFPSRQAPKPAKPRRKPRIHRTGRNQQLTVKATGDTIDRFYRFADLKKVPLGELLRLALDALEGEETER
jgi:hypothetical protein